MTTYHFKNTTHQSKAIKVLGGFHIMKPNSEETIENCHELSEDRIRNLAAGGLIVSAPVAVEAPEPKRRRKDETSETDE